MKHSLHYTTPHLDDIAGEVQVCQGIEGELVGDQGGGHGVDPLAAEAAVGEVEVLGAPGQVAHHLGDVGQTLVLDKIYAEKIESVSQCSF